MQKNENKNQFVSKIKLQNKLTQNKIIADLSSKEIKNNENKNGFYFDIIVVGGGAAGMMAAIIAARQGVKVLLIEKNEKPGKKLYITGKGRCNLSNASDIENHLSNINNGSKFMISALNAFSPDDCISFFNLLGLKTKIERGKRVFPVSDKSSDVIKVLENELKKLNVAINLNESVELINKDKHFIVCTNKASYTTNSVIICTGGLSYPFTGSTGFGFEAAKSFNHKVVSPVPALVAVNVFDDVKELAGLTLKNVNCSVVIKNKVAAKNFGELLFTHSGVSGPAALTLSSKINRLDLNGAKFLIDLKPALSAEQLEQKFIREFKENSNLLLSNYLKLLLPKSLINFFMEKTKLPNIFVRDLTKEHRINIIKTLKTFDLNIKNLDNIENAIITSGGVSLNEINPKTMESKIVPHLYFAGEVLNIDAMTGGYNLQIAFSTGYAAGHSAAKAVSDNEEFK